MTLVRRPESRGNAYQRDADRIYGEMQQILDAVAADKRTLLTPEEKRQYDALERQFVEAVALAKDPPVRRIGEETGAGAVVDGLALRSDQSMVDWMQARGRISQEDSQLSFGKLVRGAVTGNWDDAGQERRALAEGTDSAGGFLVPAPLAGSIIDRMRAASTVLRAGAQVVPFDSQTLAFARLATDPTASWHTESAAISDNTPTFEQVTLTARTMVSLVKASRELVEDAVNLEDALYAAFAGAMAGELDRVALAGSGVAPEPEGIFNADGVGVVSMGTNGAQLTNWTKFLDALQELEDANAGPPTAAIMAPRTSRTINGFVDTTGQPLRRPQALEDVPFYTTTNVAVDDIQGTAENASALYLGNFPDLIWGVRAELRIEVLKELYAGNYQYGFLAHLRADVQLARPASFAVIKGIIP